MPSCKGVLKTDYTSTARDEKKTNMEREGFSKQN